MTKLRITPILSIIVGIGALAVYKFINFITPLAQLYEQIIWGFLGLSVLWWLWDKRK